jgi:hypothetical protein
MDKFGLTRRRLGRVLTLNVSMRVRNDYMGAKQHNLKLKLGPNNSVLSLNN